jgi:hypothetical protein
MNWIFEVYSDVYNAAMMQAASRPAHVAVAKGSTESKRFSLFRPFTKG